MSRSELRRSVEIVRSVCETCRAAVLRDFKGSALDAARFCIEMGNEIVDHDCETNLTHKIDPYPSGPLGHALLAALREKNGGYWARAECACACH